MPTPPEHDHTHECRDCGNEIPGGVACGPISTPSHPEDCDWPGGDAGCDCNAPEAKPAAPDMRGRTYTGHDYDGALPTSLLPPGWTGGRP